MDTLINKSGTFIMCSSSPQQWRIWVYQLDTLGYKFMSLIYYNVVKSGDNDYCY